MCKLIGKTYRILGIICLFILSSVSLMAQENRTFRIYDATDVVDKKGRFIQIVDSDNGRPMSDMGLTLDQLDGDVVVYVVFSRWGNLLMNDLLNNQNKAAVQSFFTFYDNNNSYCLWPNSSGIYNTDAIRAIGERLKKQFASEVAEWEKKDELFNTDELAIIVKKAPFIEELFPVEWIDLFEPNNQLGDCPLYYTGKLKIQESEKRFVRSIDFEESAIQVGNELLFNETFDISGPVDKRMVVDRYVEICTFDEDYNKLANRIDTVAFSAESATLNRRRSAKLMDLLGHMDADYKKKYRENPYVFPGEKFQRLLRRRMSWDLRRDTLEHYRGLTQKAFSMKNIKKDFYEVAVDTVDFRMDYNLFHRYLSKYRTFWAISPIFERMLPADGGETYEDSASVKKYHHLRTDVAAYEKLREYMDNGRRLKGSSETVVEGFVPPIYTIRAQRPKYSEYWLSDEFFDKLKQDDDYDYLVRNHYLSFIRRELGGNRLRVDNDYKKEFNDIFENMSLSQDSLFLSEKPLKDTAILYWTMPDPDLFYKLKHVNYLHDFMNADTTSSECTCARTIPLRFLSLSSDPAEPDCPPMINGRYYEDYKPKSKTDDPQSVEREAHLTFLQGSDRIDQSLGTNAVQLDSLKRAADEILGRVSFAANTIAHRIDTITILGISSPEGTYYSNLELAHHRSESLINWVKANCGINYVNTVYKDSVSTWKDVGIIARMTPEEAEAAYRARNPIVLDAMEQLRKVNLRFVYTALVEPSEESIVNVYRSGGTGDIYGAYYYYTLLKSDKITHEEKLSLAEEVINHGTNNNFRMTRDVNRANSEHWYELIKPLAANYIAVDKIRQKKWDRELLAPYIDMRQQGNSASYSIGHMINDEVPKAYKYVNADFVLYNQIQMLMGEGNTAALQTADSLLQILSITSYSPEFEIKYKPSKLIDLLECYNRQSFLSDRALAERIKTTNIVNFYVINMAIGHEAYFTSGTYSEPEVARNFRECCDSLSVLEELPDDRAEKFYFKAVTLARYAEMTLGEDKPQLLLDARNALVDLFMLNENMIGMLQGDRYIREIYRLPDLREKKIDIYLEAVEEYIKRWSRENG